MTLNRPRVLPLLSLAIALASTALVPQTALSCNTAGCVLFIEVGADPMNLTEPGAEFIELYNTTAAPVDLTGWTITDNAGTINLSGIIPANGKIVLIADATLLGPTGYACSVTPLNVQPASWSNGLSNSGDRFTLTNNLSTVIDALSYGSDTTIFNPAAPDVFTNNGTTLQRSAYPNGPFVDTDTAADWGGSTGVGTPCDVPVPVELMGFSAE